MLTNDEVLAMGDRAKVLIEDDTLATAFERARHHIVQEWLDSSDPAVGARLRAEVAGLDRLRGELVAMMETATVIRIQQERAP